MHLSIDFEHTIEFWSEVQLLNGEPPIGLNLREDQSAHWIDHLAKGLKCEVLKLPSPEQEAFLYFHIDKVQTCGCECHHVGHCIVVEEWQFLNLQALLVGKVRLFNCGEDLAGLTVNDQVARLVEVCDHHH